MPPKKRKGAAADASEEPPSKKSQQPSNAAATKAPTTRAPRASTRSQAPSKTRADDESERSAKLEPSSASVAPTKASKPSTAKRGPKKASQPAGAAPTDDPKPPSSLSSKPPAGVASQSSTRNFWLMKAEPNTRLENGHDVKFSIDDLAARTSPEPWDGIRNHVAKNNLLAMKKGDLAFFYHSNCKIPGVVGVMEIVQEASPDESAWDSKSAYYDPKSGPDKRTWYLVHVKFRKKFEDIVSLKQLQEHKAPGGRLEKMQLHKLSRLSVSKVEQDEWDFIISLAEDQIVA